MQLNDEVRHDLVTRGFSRRHFGRIAALMSAGAAMPLVHEGSLAHAQLSSLGRSLPPGAVKINANENPNGPAPAALEALMRVAKNGGRYQYQETYAMMETAAKLEGLKSENFIPYPGSSLALHHGVIAFVSPERGLVTVDPGYEAAARAAEAFDVPVERVPLIKKGARHDVKAMMAAAKKMNAGMIYICNPNNPTGTTTSRKDIEYVLANKPAGSIVLLDEAYIHFTDEPFGSDLVKAGKDVIVLRTFSKIYGMAGLRAGFAMARPDLLAKMRKYASGALPVTGMIAATESLKDSELVPGRKAKVGAIRSDLYAFMDKKGFEYTPSKSCKFMVDTRMPVQKFIDGMREHNVFVGRPWMAWPTWNRVSIGTEKEMEKFKAAFVKVVS